MYNIMAQLNTPTATDPTRLAPEVLVFLIAEFIAIKVRPDALNTRIAYLEDLRKLGDFTMGDLSDRKLLSYKIKVIDSDRNGQPRASRTANRMLSVTRKFLRFLQEKRILATNYFDLVDGQRIDKHDSPYIALKDHEVRAMIDRPDRGTVLGSSQRLAFVLAFYLGLRCSEICSIRYGDIVEGVLTITGKGKKVRRIPLTETLLMELNAHMSFMALHVPVQDPKRHLIESRESQGGKMASSTLWRWFRGASEMCGVSNDALRAVGKKVSPHSARATAITKALDNGVGIREVSILAGHSSIETTVIYDKRRGEAAKEAVMAIKY